MPKLPCISPEKLKRVLEKCGFELERIKGIHHFYHNPETKKSASVPLHGKDIPKGLLNEIPSANLTLSAGMHWGCPQERPKCAVKSTGIDAK
jgi:predicted RNA binding protein YcfA (HicA-like mRNA interferase family)